MTIEIKTDNAAFEGDNYGPELANILEHLAQDIIDGARPTPGEPMPLYDVNGNRVGQWTA